MTKPTKPKPTADELVHAATDRLRMRTGWYVSQSGRRITIHITYSDADRLIERLDNSDQWEALQAELREISRDTGGDAA